MKTEILTCLAEIRWTRCSRPLPEVLPLKQRFGLGGYGILCYVGAWLHTHMVLACREAGSRILTPKIMERTLTTVIPPNWNDYEQLAASVIHVLCFWAMWRVYDYEKFDYTDTKTERQIQIRRSKV